MVVLHDMNTVVQQLLSVNCVIGFRCIFFFFGKPWTVCIKAISRIVAPHPLCFASVSDKRHGPNAR